MGRRRVTDPHPSTTRLWVRWGAIFLTLVLVRFCAPLPEGAGEAYVDDYIFD